MLLLHSIKLARWCGCALAAGLAFPLAAGTQPRDPYPWQTVAEDLEAKRVVRWPEAVLSPELLLVRTRLRRYRLGVMRAQDFGTPRSSVRALCLRAKAVFGINANFFDENGKALGLIVSRGNLLQRIHAGGKTLTGVFQLTRSGVSIVQRDAFTPEAAVEAVQAGPRLLIDRQAVHGLRDASSYSRRAGVCIDGQSRLIFFISSGLAGISLEEIQEALREKEVDCRDALNLDGGGSAQLFLSKDLPGATSRLEELSVQGSDDVPVVLGLFPRQ